MRYYSGKHTFKKVGNIINNQTNEICLCEKQGGKDSEYSLFWIIKDRSLAKSLLKVFHETNETPLYLETFSSQENTVFVLPYKKERSLFRFFWGELVSQKEQEQVWRKLVEICMASDIPYPFMYEILRQRRINIDAQGELEFSYVLDFRKFQPECGEADCANMCADAILELMELAKSGNKKLQHLVKRKCEGEGYHSFVELFQDIKSNGTFFSRNIESKKEKLQQNVGKFVKNHKNTGIRLFAALCLILVVIALFFLISQLIYGEIPILRLFQNSFQTIGTENLVE